jgi:CHAD domain-containing protein
VEAAVRQLRRDSRDDLPTAVHGTRKSLKQVRSLLRLVRDDLGEDRYRSENARYRYAAQLLSSSRDAQVKLETLAALRRRYGDEVPAMDGLEQTLSAERERLAGSLGGVGDADRAGSSGGKGDARDRDAAVDEAAATIERRLEQAAQEIEAGAAAIAEWRLESSGWKLMRSGLERSYRRGRVRFAKVQADPTPEGVHEWRKRVKDLWYHLRLLRGIWPEAMQGPVDAAHELSDLLGDHHDLSVLAQDVHDDNGRDAHSKALLGLIERRQRELLAAAIPLGERLYAEKPKQFAGRLSAYWDAWQGE